MPPSYIQILDKLKVLESGLIVWNQRQWKLEGEGIGFHRALN